uniref:Uncharacterized protein n=1 Tax=Arundo donax TaxID=35708 RepID=A0A0A9FQF6_ARUDO
MRSMCSWAPRPLGLLILLSW